MRTVATYECPFGSNADIGSISLDVRFVPIADTPNAEEKRVSLTLKATRANLAKKEKPDLRDAFFIGHG
jgi:hypothetical protein